MLIEDFKKSGTVTVGIRAQDIEWG